MIRRSPAGGHLSGLHVLALAALVLANPLAAQEPAIHPLDPLTREEVTTAVAVLREDGRMGGESLFPVLTLHEPPKEEVLAHRAGAPFRREAFAVVLDRKGNRTFEAVVDLRGRRVREWTPVPGVQPAILIEEFVSVPGVVRADPRWQAAMRRRGITDFERVQIDTWAPGYLGDPAEHDGARRIRALSYYKGEGTNAYAHPVEGVLAVVNTNTMKVERVIDTGVVPLAPEGAELGEAANAPLRTGLKPLRILQPEGTSFTVEGNEVRWQKWVFRFSMHPREGLVLHTVGYEDAGRVRPVLYRASLSEMVVPYAETDTTWTFRNAFDLGEYGVGRLANPLEPGTDAPENAVFFDAVFADDAGEPYEHPRAAALFERDGGILWKHFNLETQENEARRSRELVLSYVATVGNYDYGISWIFRQDGTLELAADLTGIMQVRGVPAATAGHGHDAARFGHLVAPGLAAVHHQHFFNFRLDMDVDGARNRVVESNTRALPRGPQNPHGNAFVMEETPLGSELRARRELSLASNRKWKVVSASERNRLGQPTGYLLVPVQNALPYAAPDAVVRQRAGFIDHHFWATRFDPRQMHGAGWYPNQSRGGDGLPAWTADDAALDAEDVVVWYTLGVTHVPRPEEWPVMPVHRVGFKLVPAGFFERNPAMDVPR